MTGMADEIEIVVGDVNDIEARVQARYADDAGNVVVSGTIRGPFCDKAHTLPADYSFRGLGSGVAEAVVPDPCTWSPEVPHVYRVDVTARRGEEIVAEFRGEIGLRRSSKQPTP
jgi:beta-galactosidase/beta-glucuronidase